MGTQTDIRRGPGALLARRTRAAPGPRAALGPTSVLTAVLAVTLFGLVMGPAELATHPKPLPSPFDLGQRQGLETSLFFLSFAVILPAACLLVPRLADAIARGPNADGLGVLAAVLLGLFAVAVIAARLIPGGVGATLTALAIFALLAAGALGRAGRRRPWPPLLAQARRERFAWGAAGVLLLLCLGSFTSLESISPVGLVTAAGVAACGLALRARLARGRGAFGLGRRWRAAFDAGGIGLVLLAVPDLVIFRAAPGASPLDAAIRRSVLQLHQDFVLGPVNVILHGGAVLVDTASQYGVGSLYFLAGWFRIAPIGYGTLGLLDGILFGLFFAAGYSVLRLARAPRALSLAAIATALVALVYNLQYSIGSLPAQHGPLRFGLPMVLILAVAVAERRQSTSRVAGLAPAVVLGIASVWAFEAFAYTAITFAAIAGFRAWLRPAGRVAWLVRQAAGAVVACVLAHLVLILATLVFAGQLPDYGRYLAFLTQFAVGKVGDLTYDFTRWSPGVAVGAAYAVSAIGLVLVSGRRREALAAERATLTVLTGLTAYGIALFSYFVNRSADHILPYVGFPALLAGALWVSLLGRAALGTSPTARRGGPAFALGVCVLLVAVGWSSIGERFDRSALGHVVPGGESPRAALRTLWRLPPLDTRTPAGVALAERYVPGSRRLLTLVAPDLETEILIRSGRINRLPLSYPSEDSFASGEYVPRLRTAIAGLRPGDRLLTQGVGVAAFDSLRAHPTADPLARRVTKELAPLQEWVLQQLGHRFDLHVLHRDGQGFVVAELRDRS